jgi:hypothetical protein
MAKLVSVDDGGHLFMGRDVEARAAIAAFVHELTWTVAAARPHIPTIAPQRRSPRRRPGEDEDHLRRAVARSVCAVACPIPDVGRPAPAASREPVARCRRGIPRGWPAARCGRPRRASASSFRAEFWNRCAGPVAAVGEPRRRSDLPGACLCSGPIVCMSERLLPEREPWVTGTDPREAAAPHNRS